MGCNGHLVLIPERPDRDGVWLTAEMEISEQARAKVFEENVKRFLPRLVEPAASVADRSRLEASTPG